MKGHINNMFKNFEYKYVANTLKCGSCQFKNINKFFITKCKLNNKKFNISNFLFENSSEHFYTTCSFLDNNDNLCFMYIYITDNDNDAMNELEFRKNFFIKFEISATIDCYTIIDPKISKRYLYLVRINNFKK